jgi:hypothetical protein
MLWVSAAAGGGYELWTAGSDGSARRIVGTGGINLYAPPHFVTNTRIELMLNGDLVWLDLSDDPVALHDVAAHSGIGIDLTPPWLLAIYQFSPSDRTGILGLINRDTGAKRPVSELVAGYARVSLAPPPEGPPLASTIYLVRGRNPSPQDGFWLANITAADLL